MSFVCQVARDHRRTEKTCTSTAPARPCTSSVCICLCRRAVIQCSFEAQLHFFLFKVVFHFSVFLNCMSTSRFPVPHSVRASVVAMATLFRAVLAIFLQDCANMVQPYGEHTVLLQCIVFAVALQSYFCK